MQVRLAQTWTDAGGAAHRAGELVDVDAITLAKLEASGVVTPNESPEPRRAGDWAGPTGPERDKADVAGPTGDELKDEKTAGWAGPTDDDR